MNKGYTLIEFIVVMVLLGILGVISKPIMISNQSSIQEVVAFEIYRCQMKAMKEKDFCEETTIAGLHFNFLGNANKANTYYGNFGKLVIQLGFGRFRFE